MKKKLPTDLTKLEWLCKLPKKGLEKVLEELDCKQAKRSEVVEIVRQVLGKVNSVAKKQMASIKESIDAFFIAIIERAQERSPIRKYGRRSKRA